MTNWAKYDAGLRRRGSLTLWVTEEVIDGRQAAPRSSRGGQAIYSDLNLEAGLMPRLAFHLPLRQTQGLMACLFELLGVALSVPDHSTLSRRAMSPASVSKACRLPAGPVPAGVGGRLRRAAASRMRTAGSARFTDNEK